MVRSQNSVPRAIVWLILIAAAVACQSGNNSSRPEAMATPTTAPSPSVTPTPTKPPPPPDWEKRWLQGIPCRAPCWEGLTPGQTTASEAVRILSGSPIVANVHKEARTLMPELGDVFWNRVDGKNGGEANYPAKDPAEIIYRIRPVYGEYFRLQEVMQAYGEPSHVVAIGVHPPDSNTIYYTLWVIYLPQGFVVRGGGPIKPDLDENTRFYQVVFFIPNLAGVENSVDAAKDHSDWVIPWQGFRGFEFYCRDIAGGKSCRGETKPR